MKAAYSNLTLFICNQKELCSGNNVNNNQQQKKRVNFPFSALLLLVE